MGGQGWPEHFSIAELAGLLDVGPKTVSNWITGGLITVKRGPGNRVAIPSAGVLEFLPPRGDALMRPSAVYVMTRWTKAQLAYGRRKGRFTVITTPSGATRYLRSEIIAAFRARKGLR
jgi:hypothetical protein